MCGYKHGFRKNGRGIFGAETDGAKRIEMTAKISVLAQDIFGQV
jgi:hypothetical protein